MNNTALWSGSLNGRVKKEQRVKEKYLRAFRHLKIDQDYFKIVRKYGLREAKSKKAMGNVDA